jgi:hypothetical protein
MNTRDLGAFDGWDENELGTLVARFVRTFHRLPSADELVKFRRTRSGLQLRLPRQARRSIAGVVATL